MKIQVDFEKIQSRHPEVVKAVVSKLRKGKSQHKNARPEDLKWFYYWGVSCEALSFGEMIRQASMPKMDELDQSIDEKLEDMKKRISFWVNAELGRWYGQGSASSDNIPPEIVEHYRHVFEEEAKEKAKYDKMPQAEKDRQADEALKQLRGMPGFFEISIGGKK